MSDVQIYIILFVIFVIIDIFVFRSIYRTRKIMKKYFPGGIDAAGLEKMKLTLGREKYKKFLQKTISGEESLMISWKEKGKTITTEQEQILSLLRQELEKMK